MDTIVSPSEMFNITSDAKRKADDIADNFDKPKRCRTMSETFVDRTNNPGDDLISTTVNVKSIVASTDEQTVSDEITVDATSATMKAFVLSSVDNTRRELMEFVKKLRSYKLTFHNDLFANNAAKRNLVTRKFTLFMKFIRKLSTDDFSENALKIILCDLSFRNVLYKFCANKAEYHKNSINVGTVNIFSFLDEKKLTPDIDYLSRAVFDRMALEPDTSPKTPNVVAKFQVRNVRANFIVKLLGSEIKQGYKCNARFELENGNSAIAQFFSEFESKVKQTLRKAQNIDVPVMMVFSGRGSQEGKNKEEANDYYFLRGPDENTKSIVLDRRDICSEGVFVTDGFGVRVCSGGNDDSPNKCGNGSVAARGELKKLIPTMAQAIVYVKIGFLVQ